MIYLEDRIESTFIKCFDSWGDYSGEFYGAELACDIGPFKTGDVVDLFLFDYETSRIQIFDKDDTLLVDQKIKAVFA